MNEHWTQQHIEKNKDTSPMQLWMQFVGIQLLFAIGLLVVLFIVFSVIE